MLEKKSAAEDGLLESAMVSLKDGVFDHSGSMMKTVRQKLMRTNPSCGGGNFTPRSSSRPSSSAGYPGPRGPFRMQGVKAIF